MGKVQIGNGFYFMYIGIAAIMPLLLILLLRKKNRKIVRIVLLVLLFANFAMHFLKQVFPPYKNNFPTSLANSAMENICGVSTILFPFIYLFNKQNAFHDFAYFIGVIGGLVSIFYPIGALGASPFVFNSIRFYLCHTILFAVPMTAAVLGVYRPRFSRFWAIPLIFIIWQALICASEYSLIALGIIKGEFSNLLNPSYRNGSLTFGVRPDYAWMGNFLDPFVPWFLRTDAFGINGGKDFYFPVLWLVLPAFVYLIPVYLIVSSPFWIYELVKRRKNS